MAALSPVLLVSLLGTLPGQGGDGSALRVPVCLADGRLCITRQPYEPCEGDLLFFQARNLLENVLYALACAGGPTHCGIVVHRQDGSLGLLEAPGLRYPVMLSDVSSRMHYYDGKIFVRRRCVPLTPEQSAALTAFACAQEGKRFDVVGLLRPAFGLPTRGPCVPCCCTCKELNQDRWFCSELLAAALVKAGLYDPCKIRPNFTDPEDLMNEGPIQLCPCWARYVRWERCGPRWHEWWSRSGCPPFTECCWR